MLSKLSPFYFFISFAIGLFFVYILTPPPSVIVKFPSPYNAGKITYRDTSDTCYVYKADRVECPIDKSKVRAQPVYEDYNNDTLE